MEEGEEEEQEEEEEDNAIGQGQPGLHCQSRYLCRLPRLRAPAGYVSLLLSFGI